ncbi:uncharacterized protein LOC115881811 isoform X1 [Sitophilus oryzae]|uniref:Uncharacterized protein LOC115881811 isoform X1 n=1 Tax=Sitophilus oryzae TaxID=7048 RepID=A0A6J2XXH2_SITOR|nr:uncharacterized protein LOC115881811 isoform X1 [Sitophilus oryzae]
MGSKVRDDPMWQEFEDDGLELMAYGRSRKFAVTLEGLQPLIDQTYNALSIESRYFNTFVPLSAFSYYVWSMAYARIVSLKKYERLDVDYDLLHSYQALALPLTIGDYLRSIGNIKDTTGTDYEVGFPAWPNEHGHFGRVSAENHYMYEALAAPVVIAQRMQQDVAYTRNPQQSKNWNLSADLVPAEGESAGLPTVNCLGWAPAASLNTNHKEFLESAGVDKDSIHPSLHKLQLNSSLLCKVNRYVQTARGVPTICIFKQESERGSMAQMPWQKRCHEETVSFSRTNHYCENIISERCFTLTHRRIATAALITAFRVEKDEIQGARPYCAYDFGEYKNVPDAWHQTRNKIFNYGDTEIWNRSTYRTAYTTKSNARENWLPSESRMK